MIVTELFSGPVLIGQLIRFKLETNGSVFIQNAQPETGGFSVSLMAYRSSLAASEDLMTAPAEGFVQLEPASIISDNQNSIVLAKGNYALKVLTGNAITARLNDETIDPEADKFADIDERLGLVLTQYRESPNLLGMIRAYLTEVAQVKALICEIPEKFDIDIATSDQLTIVGRWLGFPRCHNVPSAVPVFGFDCEGSVSQYNIKGFCENALWLGCPGISTARICINEDELYRKFLYVRRYQLLGRNDYASFQSCIEILFGDLATYVQAGRIITVNPNRALNDLEQSFLKVYERVLPRAVSASITITT